MIKPTSHMLFVVNGDVYTGTVSSGNVVGMDGRRFSGGLCIFLALVSLTLVGVGNVFLRDLEKHDSSRHHRVDFKLTDSDNWRLHAETGVFDHEEVYVTIKRGTTVCLSKIVRGPLDAGGLGAVLETMAYAVAPTVETTSRSRLFGTIVSDALPNGTLESGVLDRASEIANEQITVDPTSPAFSDTGNLPVECVHGATEDQFAYAILIARSPQWRNPRETVLMRILGASVALKGVSEDTDKECHTIGYVDVARALRSIADEIEQSAMLATLFGILVFIALVPTVLGSLEPDTETSRGAMYQLGLMLSLGLATGIYCYLVASVPVEARELADHVSNSGVPPECFDSSITTTTEHNMEAIDGTFYAATACSAVAFFMAATLSITSEIKNENFGGGTSVYHNFNLHFG